VPEKRQVLDLLTGAELVRKHAAIVGGRARSHLAGRPDEKGPAVPWLLAGFRRGRLQQLSQALDI